MEFSVKDALLFFRPVFQGSLALQWLVNLAL